MGLLNLVETYYSNVQSLWFAFSLVLVDKICEM